MALNYDYYEDTDEGGGASTRTFYDKDGRVVGIERTQIRFGLHYKGREIPYPAPADDWPEIIE